MKNLLAILLVLPLVSCAGMQPMQKVTDSGLPEVVITGVPADVVAGELINNMVNSGYVVTNTDNRALTFDRPMESVLGQMLFGTRFNSQPNNRVVYMINEVGGNTRVVASLFIVVNPGSGYEKVHPHKNGQTLDNYQGKLEAMRDRLTAK